MLTFSSSISVTPSMSSMSSWELFARGAGASTGVGTMMVFVELSLHVLLCIGSDPGSQMRLRHDH